MKNFIILLFAILTLDASAVCTSPISRANNGANSVLTSSKYNLDVNTAYNKINNLPGDCVVDNSINGTKLIDASVTIDKMAANSIDTAKIVDGSITAAKLAAAIQNLVPVGAVITFAGATPPAGYLLCNGASVSRTTYAALYAVVGSAYGSADGVSFNLPDYRGRFIRGVDGGAGNDLDRSTRTAATGGNAGDTIGSYQGSQFQSHQHPVSWYFNLGYPVGWVDNGYVGIGGTGPIANFAAGSGSGTSRIQPNGVSVGGNETRPVNGSANFIIKY